MGYSSFEFAFSQSGFQKAYTPFLSNQYATQLLLLNAGVHYISSFGIITGLTAGVAWAANHDKRGLFHVKGSIGDSICYSLIMMLVMEWVAHSMIIYSIVAPNGSLPPGWSLPDIYFTCYGVQLIFKDIMLAVGVIYFVVIRIYKWACWGDFENRPILDDEDSGGVKPSPASSNISLSTYTLGSE